RLRSCWRRACCLSRSCRSRASWSSSELTYSVAFFRISTLAALSLCASSGTWSRSVKKLERRSLRRWRSRMLWLRLRSLSSESEPQPPRGLLSPPLPLPLPPPLRLERAGPHSAEEEDEEEEEEDQVEEEEEDIVLATMRGTPSALCFCFLEGGQGSSSEAYGEGAAISCSWGARPDDQPLLLPEDPEEEPEEPAADEPPVLGRTEMVAVPVALTLWGTRLRTVIGRADRQDRFTCGGNVRSRLEPPVLLLPPPPLLLLLLLLERRQQDSCRDGAAARSPKAVTAHQEIVPSSSRLFPMPALFLLTGKGNTMVGSTHDSDTAERLNSTGILTLTSRLLLLLPLPLLLPPLTTPVVAAAADAALLCSFSVTTRSSFSLAENPLHIQSWMMMLSGLLSIAEAPNRSPSDAPQMSSSGRSRSSEAQSRGSPNPKPMAAATASAASAGSPAGSAALLGERGGVGSNSNFFQMSSPGGAESGPQK
ncbi:hypothetical protein CRUP_003177, partial [Coryphaenoides rupestris]